VQSSVLGLPDVAAPCHRRVELPPSVRAARRHACLALAAYLFSLVFAWAPPASGSDFVASPAGSKLDRTWGVGSWIWTTETHDRQTCRFWRTFAIPASSVVTNARLWITGDNAYHLFLDGRELGQGFEWRSITEHDLTQILSPGVHVLAVEAFNEYNEAGLLVGLRVSLKDGRTLEVASDESWYVVPDTERHWTTRSEPRPDWPKARIMAAFGAGPWGWTMRQEAQGTGVPNPWFHITRDPPHRPMPFEFWHSGWLQVILAVLCGLALLVCFRLFTQLSLHKKAHHILELERVRIARDIHDELGAGLTQLVLFGEVSKREFTADSVACGKLAEVCLRGRNLLRAIDEVVWLVNARRDTLRDFETYICTYAEKFLLPASIRCRFEINELPEAAFDLAIRRNLFLAVKEALNNAARHSGATEVLLSFRLQGGDLAVAVVDNGKGFDVTRADASRNGLSNMAQRLAEVGGSCRVSSQPGQGCRIEFTAPLAAAGGWRRWWPRTHRSARETTELASSKHPAIAQPSA
jgi:signal transduction histidine kinase